MRLRPLQVRNLNLVTATFAPRDDFEIGSKWEKATVLGLMAGVLLLSLIFAHQFSRSMASAVQQLVAEFERMGALRAVKPGSIAKMKNEIQIVDTHESLVARISIAFAASRP